MKQFIFVLALGLLLAASTPNVAQETQEKKVLVIPATSAEDETPPANVWISKDDESKVVKGQAMFIGSETADKEKDISVNVNKSIKDGKEVSTFEVTIADGGNQEVITWESNGEGIPANVERQLKAHGLDIQMFQTDDEMTVTVDADNAIEKKSRTVDVYVNSEINNDKEERTVELNIEEDGKVQKLKWVDDGEVPEEIKQTLDDLGIDVEILSGGHGSGDYDIEIEKDGDDAEGHAAETEVKVYKIKLEEDEEISDELKQELEQYGVDIDQLIKDAKAQKVGEEPVRIKKQIKIEKKNLESKDGHDVHIIRLKDGEELPDEVRQVLDKHNIKLEKAGSAKEKRVMKIKEGNGKVKILEWDGEGEMPAEMKKHMDKMEKGGMGLHEHKTTSPNKAQFGVMVADTDNGVLVDDVVEHSAAAQVGIQPGDVITHVDGTQIHDALSLVSGLSNKVPGDKIEVTFLRNNEKKMVDATLTAPRHSNETDIETEVEIEISNCNTDNFTGDEAVDLLFKTSGNSGRSKSIVIVRDVDNTIKTIDIKGETEEIIEESKVQTEIASVPEVNNQNKLSLKNFQAFPNPTNGIVNIQFDADNSPTIVQLNDMSGRTIFKETLNQFNGTFNKDVDLTNGPRGQFVLYVVQEGKVFTRQIVLQ